MVFAAAIRVKVVATPAIGAGLVMLAAGALYASYGGRAYLFMALLSAAGLVGTTGLRHALAG